MHTWLVEMLPSSKRKFHCLMSIQYLYHCIVAWVEVILQISHHTTMLQHKHCLIYFETTPCTTKENKKIMKTTKYIDNYLRVSIIKKNPNDTLDFGLCVFLVFKNQATYVPCMLASWYWNI